MCSASFPFGDIAVLAQFFRRYSCYALIVAALIPFPFSQLFMFHKKTSAAEISSCGTCFMM